MCFFVGETNEQLYCFMLKETAGQLVTSNRNRCLEESVTTGSVTLTRYQSGYPFYRGNCDIWFMYVLVYSSDILVSDFLMLLHLLVISQEEPEAMLPRISPSLFLTPGGAKFYQLLYRFSRYVILQVSDKENGRSNDIVDCWNIFGLNNHWSKHSNIILIISILCYIMKEWKTVKSTDIQP